MPSKDSHVPKGLGDDDELTAAEWVTRVRKNEKTLKRDQEEAARKQKEYDEHDNMIEETEIEVPDGVKVMHDANAFATGTSTILTLKDTPVLDDLRKGIREDGDELEDIHILEQEKREYKKKQTNVKNMYNQYDDLEKGTTTLLPQYDDENMSFTRKGFSLKGGVAKPEATAGEEYGEMLEHMGGVQKYSLDSKPKVQSDYQTAAEAATVTDKPATQKKTRLRKKQSTKDIVSELEKVNIGNMQQDHSSRSAPRVDKEAQKMVEQLQRRMKAYETAKMKSEQRTNQLLSISKGGKDEEVKKEEEGDEVKALRVKMETDNDEFDEKETVVFDPTEEFCKALSTRKERQPKRKEETETKQEPEQEEDDYERSYEQSRFNIMLEKTEVMEEPQASGSCAAAMELIRQRGLMEKSYTGRQNDKVIDLAANDPAPGIKLQYLDEWGQPMTQKEAYRRLSWKFHNKVPGKNKQEKKRKNIQEKEKLRSMGATDTPLHSVEALKRTQEATKQAFVIIQGGMSDQTGAQPQLSKKELKRKAQDNPAGSESTVEIKRIKK